MFHNSSFRRRPESMRIGILLVVMLCGAMHPAVALKDDASQPIKIDADHATLDQKQMVSVFDGRVVITKGTLVVHADQGVASQDKDGDRVLDLYGKPVTFIQRADDGQLIEGQCNKFNYNTKTSLAVLSGRARVKKGKSIVIGDTLSYNTQTQIYSAVSGLASGVSRKFSGRVTVILDQPDQVGKK